jgi:hypothetical protein
MLNKYTLGQITTGTASLIEGGYHGIQPRFYHSGACDFNRN